MTVNLHVRDSGPRNGRPVVLIHGFPLSSESFTPQFAELEAAGYRVVAYDRRGFGQSDRPTSGFDYDTLAADLNNLLVNLDLREVALVGFSMGGGEIARFVANHGEQRLQRIVFAAAVPPYLMQRADNPEGPLTEEKAAEKMELLSQDRETYFDSFTTLFFTAHERLLVSESERQFAIDLCRQSDQTAALGCMKAFIATDFREDLRKVSVPTLVLHGDADAVVPFEGSGQRTHQMVAHSKLKLLRGAPHGCNVSHAREFNQALLDFCQES